MPQPARHVSLRRLAANRANARRSTGPRTPEGKARSAQNARRHGLRAFKAARNEEMEELDRLRAGLTELHQPANDLEIAAVERLALAQQALLRVARLEAGLFSSALHDVLSSESAGPSLRADRNFALAEGFRHMNRRGNDWTLFLRYQAQAERQYRRALEELERLQALRDEQPNEPNEETEPEAAQSDATTQWAIERTREIARAARGPLPLPLQSELYCSSSQGSSKISESSFL